MWLLLFCFVEGFLKGRRLIQRGLLKAFVIEHGELYEAPIGNNNKGEEANVSRCTVVCAVWILIKLLLYRIRLF